VTAKISVSMMCADIGKLPETLETFRSCGVDYLHIDVTDGIFAPNFTLGTDYARRLRELSAIPLDIHLMVERPEDKSDWFGPRPGEYVSVHYESTPHVHRALRRISEAGARPMIALNPATHYRVVEHLLDDIDAVLVMAVNPGFAGQKLIDATLKKISDLRGWLDAAGYGRVGIEVDGNVSFTNAKKMREAGADIFVAGSSSVFDPEYSLSDAIGVLRRSIDF